MYRILLHFLLPAAFTVLHSNIISAQAKPQTPTPPYSYISDSVEYDNEDKSVHLAGTFTYPATNGPFVTILLVNGSGQQDRNSTILGHQPFAVLADYFTKQGYAVLRVDDRGKGKSRGELVTATSESFANDALTSIRYLLTRKEVKKKKIGIIGHSEGGLIAPLVYSKWPKLSFIISLAGSAVSGAEILLKQQTDPVKEMAGKDAYDAYYQLTQKTLYLIHDSPGMPDSLILREAKNIYTKWKASQPDSILVPLRADKATAEMYAMQVKQELIPWLRYFITTHPYKFWEKVKCPVLALNGEKDIQVYPEENLSAIREALSKNGNKKITTQIIPGLNHLFQSCKKCTVNEYGTLEETFSPAVLQIMSDWLKKNIH